MSRYNSEQSYKATELYLKIAQEHKLSLAENVTGIYQLAAFPDQQYYRRY